MVASGCGLAQRKAPEQDDLSEGVRAGRFCKVLSVAVGEASSNYSMIWFLAIHQRLCLVPIADPSF
eukprot:9642690-Lingulodinium_polyedra.AAC.1